MSRYSDAIKILGPKVHETIRSTPVLVVGAGGIGSELLKNMVLVGFENITIVDLDTIDLSNLNRQFLFRKPDISKPKASVAAATARQFNPKCTIDARHANIKDEGFDSLWFAQFGLVFGALDNMDARRHVNKMCLTANVPLIESGTAGFAGQVQPIIPGRTTCYDCKARPVPKTFPVCTIRATPSTPIHCIVWAKSYLFVQLFGEDDETTDQEELNKAAEDGENAGEIENLKKEAAAFRAVRKAMGTEGGARRVFEKVFNEDINRLLQMKEMWTVPGRIKPTPLDYDAIMDGSFVLPPSRQAAATPAPGSAPAPAAAKDQSGLKDQQETSLKENLVLFLSRCEALAERLAKDPTAPLAFDKDDDETLDFVCATSNLRSFAYGIEPQTRFKVKEMAGNIIPAIATTNAIIAGMVVFQAVRVLAGQLSAVREPNLQRSEHAPIISYLPAGPNPGCPTSSEAYLMLACDPARVTLGEVLADVVRGAKGLAYGADVKLSVYEAGRLLNEPDYGDDGDDDDRLNNESKTLEQLGCGVGTWLSIVDEEDEDERFQTVSISICKLRDTTEASQSFALPSTLPTVSKVAPPPKPEHEPEAAPEANGLVAAAGADADSDSDIEAFDATPPPPPTTTNAAAAAQKPGAIVGKKRSLSDDAPAAAPPAPKKIKGLDFAVNADDQIEIDMSDDE